MRIAEVAARSGLSIDTIRYYEKAGLCRAIRRGTDGKRQFSPDDVDWLVLLASLRDTGMPNKDMKHFAALYTRGDDTVAERKAMLRDHARRLKTQQARLTKCRRLLAFKLERYDEILGTTP